MRSAINSGAAIATSMLLMSGFLAGCTGDTTKYVADGVTQSQSQSQSTGTELVVEEEVEPSKFVEENNLAGTYTLEAAEDMDLTVFNTEDVVLTIGEDGSVSTQVCNNIMTSIDNDGKTGPGMSTQMYCEEPAGIMELESLVTESFDGEVEVAEAGVIFKGKTSTAWLRGGEVVNQQSE